MIRTRLTRDFIEGCNKRFKKDKSNIIARNAITSVGATLSSTDSNVANDVTHVFMNTIKKAGVKATNQGYSGRCWMFAGLNMFRHSVIHGMKLENFEFSETYLFFYDKLERSNSYLRWIIDNPESKPGDREFDYMVESSLQDGGWWNCFSNLVTKYGLIPKNAMKETFHSGDSEEMNKILLDKLHETANWIRSNPKKDLEKKIEDTMEEIYKNLVYFLGEPPKDFSWCFTNDEEDSTIIDKLTPMMFKNLVIPTLDLNDFISLANIPCERIKYNKRYKILETSNIRGGNECEVLNLRIEELKKYAMKSLLSGFPVWFVGDVSQSFHPWYSTLDDRLIDNSLFFGKNDKKFNKGKRIEFLNVQGNHAMCLTGVNLDEKGRPISWQVENSWGYCDKDTPGEDGWLSMSDSWFEKYVTEVVIHKNYLSRSILKLNEKEPIKINPWDCMAPALKANCVDAPRSWKNRKEVKKNRNL